MGRSLDAVGELRHAIAINPEYPTARSDLAEQYAILGRPEEAIAEAREAMRLGSVAPIDFWRHYSIVMAQFALGNHEEALQGAHHVMKRKPGLMRGSLFLAASAAAAGQLAEAQAAIAYCRDNLPDLRLSNVAPEFSALRARRTPPPFPEDARPGGPAGLECQSGARSGRSVGGVERFNARSGMTNFSQQLALHCIGKV